MTATTRLIYAIFFLLLLVLLPHTAWFFYQFESQEAGWLNIQWGWVTASAAAIAFESAIAVFTHKLAKHIDEVGGSKYVWTRFRKRYLNAYGIGLLISWIISTIANYTHALQFSADRLLFGERIGVELPAIAAGAILPACSLLFARAISSASESEREEDPEIAQAKQANKTLKTELTELKNKLTAAEHAANESAQKVQRFAFLLSEEKRAVILGVKNAWPGLNQTAIGEISGASKAYVSTVLNEGNHDASE